MEQGNICDIQFLRLWSRLVSIKSNFQDGTMRVANTPLAESTTLSKRISSYSMISGTFLFVYRANYHQQLMLDVGRGRQLVNQLIILRGLLELMLAWSRYLKQELGINSQMWNISELDFEYQILHIIKMMEYVLLPNWYKRLLA